MQAKYFKIFSFFLFMLLFAALFRPAKAYDFKADSGLSDTGAQAGYTDTGLTTESIPETLAGQTVKIVLSFLGIVFFLLMMYGGFKWMTAGGNEQDVEQAKNIIISAIIGLAIVVSAYGLTRLFASFIIGSGNSGNM